MFMRMLLCLGAAFYLLNGGLMLSGPQAWYLGTPGVSATGAYNHHFIVDIGFIFLVSGGAMALGVWLRQRALILAGLAWPLLHAGFHAGLLAWHGAVSDAAWVTEIGGVILPALILTALALRARLDGLGPGMARLVHAGVRQFETRWRYDASYLHRLVDLTPDAAGFMAALQRLKTRPSDTPSPLLHGASLAASLHEDCGPCAQLTVDMIRADGADPDQLRALVRRDFERADPVSALGFAYVEAALRRRTEAEAMREEIVQRFGETALADIALASIVSRTYPALKTVMGRAQACEALDVDGQSERVAPA